MQTQTKDPLRVQTMKIDTSTLNCYYKQVNWITTCIDASLSVNPHVD